ncbi:CDP-alcohol phosphatidyltransferase family protein [Gemmatimonas sp.]|uniref:CDP-alcohol phosphatidyltransferase family protein n=1 Tax=Gemmatimonas sp. TaxID=1962908 RepID=UPI003DA337AE
MSTERTTAATSLVTLPNLVSTSRVALGFGFLVADAVPVRFALIAIASLTDVLDGWLARRTHAASRIGALVDPVADRFFALCVVVGYVAGGSLSAWQALALMFRDVMSIVGWFVARNVSWLRPITFKARLLGKAVTALQLATFLVVLFAPTWTDAMVWFVFLVGAAATIDYTLMLWRERVTEPS